MGVFVGKHPSVFTEHQESEKLFSFVQNELQASQGSIAGLSSQKLKQTKQK